MAEKLARVKNDGEGNVSEDKAAWKEGNRSLRGWALRVGSPGCGGGDSFKQSPCWVYIFHVCDCSTLNGFQGVWMEERRLARGHV